MTHPNNPTALKIVLRRVSGPSSPQDAASCPSLPQQASQCLPHSTVQQEDRASQGRMDPPVPLTVNKPKRPKSVLRIRALKDPDTFPEKKRRGRKTTAPSDKTSGSSGCKRAASEMDGGEPSSPSKRALAISASYT